MNALTVRDFYDDLNYVVTAHEAATWYGIEYDELVAAIDDGLLAGRRSVKTMLVSVDSLFAVYGVPAHPGGRRALLDVPAARIASAVVFAREE